MKIAVIGCGGTGSYLLPLLVRMLKRGDTVTLIDGDSFTKENLDRQLFEERYLGKNKAVALTETYRAAKLNPIPKYLKTVEELKGFDLVFGCPDNHIARALILEAADAYKLRAVICGNEYESAAAIYYETAMKDTISDPRIRYPELLTDRSGSPVEVSCTGEAAEETPQLALANCLSASFAMSLAYFWTTAIPTEEAEVARVMPFCPLEHTWVPSKVSSLTAKQLEIANDKESSSTKDS